MERNINYAGLNSKAVTLGLNSKSGILNQVQDDDRFKQRAYPPRHPGTESSSAQAAAGNPEENGHYNVLLERHFKEIHLSLLLDQNRGKNQDFKISAEKAHILKSGMMLIALCR